MIEGASLAVLSGLTAGLLALGGVENWRHRRVLSSFRVVIHVNGTRGKSSVTRLIAAGLRAGGVPSAAKTTGTLPRLIHPDGHEEPIVRVAKANVIEQVAVLRRARELGAEAAVIECMALQPFLQWISTSRLVRPSIGVITNIRADHLDVMGPDVDGVAAALAGSVPVGGRLFVADTRCLPLLRRVCVERRTDLVVVRPSTVAEPVTVRELAGFSYVEHAENVDLALAVCASQGIERGLALHGMQLAYPDPGALTLERVNFGAEAFTIVNGFAANDPESTARVWELSLSHAAPDATRIALFNCRADRADRSQQLGEAVMAFSAADHYVVCGTGTSFFSNSALRAGLDKSRLVVAEGESAGVLARRLAHLSGSNGFVVGLGNIGGVGLELLDHLRSSRSAPLLSAAPRLPSRLPVRASAPATETSSS